MSGPTAAVRLACVCLCCFHVRWVGFLGSGMCSGSRSASPLRAALLQLKLFPLDHRMVPPWSHTRPARSGHLLPHPLTVRCRADSLPLGCSDRDEQVLWVSFGVTDLVAISGLVSLRVTEHAWSALDVAAKARTHALCRASEKKRLNRVKLRLSFYR